MTIKTKLDEKMQKELSQHTYYGNYFYYSWFNWLDWLFYC